MENIARKNVAATGYRTRDLQITGQIRYQLSYLAGLPIFEHGLHIIKTNILTKF